jgi:hypothetical protein
MEGGHMESFRASTQYGDWEGTAAADDAHRDLRDYLRDKKLIRENEFLIAASLFISDGFTLIQAFLFEGDTFEEVRKGLSGINDPIPVREITVQLTTQEFLALFHRFDVLLTWHGLELEGREYSTDQ